MQVRANHAGELPEMVAVVPEVNNEQPKPMQVKITQKQMCEIKGLHENMDAVSCLMTVCREEFQLAPFFETTDKGFDF